MIKLKSILKEIETDMIKSGIPKSTMNNSGNKVQTALLMLGIDPSLIYGVRNQIKGITYNPNSSVTGSFWNRNDEYYWKILELARNNYYTLIKSYYPDFAGKEGEEKTKELNTAWKLVYDAFKKKGYELFSK